MGHVEGAHDIWEWLTRDVSFIGGFHSPLLSWLGAAGIVALCLWHSTFLLRGVWGIRAAVERIEPQLQRLVRARQQVSAQWIVIPALAKKQTQGSNPSAARQDLDDLEELDRIMRTESTYAHEWLSFRKTLAIEQPSWFMEPTVHAGKSAAEFFSFEAACANHLNGRFYQQLPSVLTGIGLLFTFLAILIGLSKLHANGSQIEGLQGLINGLAGKFVTSIVGLACANAFLLLEKSLWHRLAGRHRRIVAMLDEIFPQKVHDYGAQNSALTADRMVGSRNGVGDNAAHQVAETVSQRLCAAVEALNAISQSLASRGSGDPFAQQEHLASHIGREVRNALSPLFDPVRSAIEDLSRTLHTPRASKPLSPEDMDRLVSHLRDRLGGNQAVAAATGTSRTGWRIPRWHQQGADDTGRA